MKKVIVVGGTGTLGKAVVDVLKKDHEVVIVGNTSGELQVDISSVESIDAMYQAVGPFDALVATAGQIKFTDFVDFTAEDYQFGLGHKLMGQVNLVLQGLKHINDKGSFTLTSGILSHDPVKMSTSAAMVNAGLDAFVKSAALEMPKGVRINVVSPTLLSESAEKYDGFFEGFEDVPAEKVARAFRKSICGQINGQCVAVWA